MYEYSPIRPTLQDFLLNDDETASMKQLQLDIHQAVLLKYFLDKYAMYLPGIPHLINCTRKQSEEKEVSNVV